MILEETIDITRDDLKKIFKSWYSIVNEDDSKDVTDFMVDKFLILYKTIKKESDVK